MRLSRRHTFAKRLAFLLRGETLKNWSSSLAIDYKRLRRWVSEGIERPTTATKSDLERLCKRLGVDVHSLWQPLDWGARCQRMLTGEESKLVLQSDKDKLVALLEGMWKRCQLLMLDREEADALQTPLTVDEVRRLLRLIRYHGLDWPSLDKPGLVRKLVGVYRAKEHSFDDVLHQLADSYGWERQPPWLTSVSPDVSPDELEQAQAFLEGQRAEDRPPPSEFRSGNDLEQSEADGFS